MAFPKFGAAGTVEDETLTYGTDELEFRDGFGTDIFPLRHTETLRRAQPSSTSAAYGIGASDDASRNSLGVNLETVTFTEEEETTDPHRLSTNPGVAPSLGDKLTYTDGLVFTRMRRTLTINGRGDPPSGMAESDRGTIYSSSIVLKPAVGDAPAINVSGLYVRRVEITKAVTDWQKFTVELVEFQGNTVAEAQNNMISPTLFTAAELDAISAWYRITRTTTLSHDNRPNIEESVEIFDDTAAP
jgi:hypothetical protein